MDNKNKLTVLVSSFACGPNWGSEIGMGWNWITNLSQFCQLHVITEKGFQEDIENAIPNLTLKYTPHFQYVDLGEKGRSLFWQQGSFKFYSHYKRWQKAAYLKALEILETEPIDLVHQLNMTGFREPGYLWKISNIPYIWGPVAGFGQVPWSYILHMSLYNKMFWGAKYLLNVFQMNFYQRIKKCAQRADLIVAATKETRKYMKKLYGRDSVIINDSGTFNDIEYSDYNKNSKVLNIIWVGIINPRKALDIALNSLARLKVNTDFMLHVCGNGPEELASKKLAEELGISNKVKFYGRLPHEKVIQLMKEADIMLFSSLMEGTPNVVNEALSLGLPVVCHDNCGHGEVVNSTCGVKIPMVNPQRSILLFAEAIDGLTDSQIHQMSLKAVERAKQLTWRTKAETMYNFYLKIYNKFGGSVKE